MHERVRFGDVPVLLRNSKDQNVEKPEDGKGGKNLLGLSHTYGTLRYTDIKVCLLV